MLSVREEDIDRITEVFYLLLKGKKPDAIKLPDGYPENEIHQMVSYINRFLSEYNVVTDISYSLARGDINFKPPPKNKPGGHSVPQDSSGKPETSDMDNPADCNGRS